ncbi:PLP-dependent cysteine synthase family protein, partial [Streptomyces sp. NPDC058418]|uniref:PLP-dependent cysteine synthase family protein n=1 Tax=Streptomyces sp. NPDC058418 TaxID=3346488 RepID=UPI00364C0731
MRYDGITAAIGDTPLVRIEPAVHGLHHIDVYAKLEMLNPFGSVKDRAAWNMVRPGLESAVEQRSQIVELSSGNTAKALSVIAGMYGLSFKSVTNRMRVPEVRDLLLLLGAEIEELPGRSECLDPTDTEDPLTLFHRALSDPDSTYLHTDQYYNESNTLAHELGTGPEILADLDGRAPDWFIACVGTAGSSTGIARALRAADPKVHVAGLVAHKSDFIPGIRTIDEVHEVGLFDPATYDSMASVHGAVRHLQTVDTPTADGERRTAVFIVCDRVESYLSYVKQRRPDLFGLKERKNSLRDVSEAELGAVVSVPAHEAEAWIRASQPL